jgi:3-deoxy-D-manno-octulosonic-acid transferase
LLLAETELWPNYIYQARKAGAQVAIINGRMSDKSLSRYLMARRLFADVLAQASLVCVQTAEDAERYLKLGAMRDRIEITGNTKLEIGALDNAPPLRRELQAFGADKLLFVAGSTAPGEEELVLDAFKRLRSRVPELVLILAPRHLERLTKIRQLIASAGLEYLNSSNLGLEKSASPVLLLDSMGELRSLYGLAAVAFVGGSLVPGRGGQSLGEPAAAAVPVLFGPHCSNQKQIADALLLAGGVTKVGDAQELATAAGKLLLNSELRRETGRKARAALQSQGGAVNSTLPHLRRLTNLL